MCRSGIREGLRRHGPRVLVCLLWMLASPPAVRAQLAALASPGALSRAHRALETAGRCEACHEVGHKVTAAKCLSCHEPIARRLAAKRGVHRRVERECATCHVEHAGVEADIRPIERGRFDHAAETGYALEGRHALLATRCEACHAGRSFLAAKTSCASCHKDVHVPTLGTDCARCHTPRIPFKEAGGQFDHRTARFPLEGAHREVACAKCHVNRAFSGLRFDACSACHATPHRRSLGAVCTACHAPASWRTTTVEHARTGFVLAGAHVALPCASCHAGSATRPIPAAGRCAGCHVNVHRESVRDDCRVCHGEDTFTRSAAFDHGARTGFPLEGRHDRLGCEKCHAGIRATNGQPLARRVVDFRGQRSACASCHEDRHGGSYGAACDACHRSEGFRVDTFRHPRQPELFAGQHASLACVKCHRPDVVPGARATRPDVRCESCHRDVHLGQVQAMCETCHRVEGAKFAPVGFSHDQAAYRLTGRHATVPCASCHARSERAYPSGTGVATNLKPAADDCRACHHDVHLGQLSGRCDGCHVTTGFVIDHYAHRPGLESLLGGFHGAYPCRACHPRETARFPAGTGTAVRFTVGRTCGSCHQK